jgi:hypothetical protein
MMTENTREGAHVRPNIQFRPGQLAGQVERRAGRAPDAGSANEVARRDLGRYYVLLERELRTVELGEAEASLITDALNGTMMDAGSWTLLWAEIDDACLLDRLHEKWDVDGGRLVAKIRAMTPGQTLALVDAVERFWQPGQVEDTGAQLRAVGLVRD